jgi:hypothetical protein
VIGVLGQPLDQLRLSGAEQAVEQRHGSTSFTISGSCGLGVRRGRAPAAHRRRGALPGPG